MDKKLIHLIRFLLLTSLIILVICSNNIRDIISYTAVSKLEIVEKLF